MIYIVIALRAEAQPIIQHYKMQLLQHHKFPLYQTETMRLIISGCGKIKAAAATAYLQALDILTEASWLNIGTAGHAEHKPGTVFLANKVNDASSQRSWYPRQLFSHALASSALSTVDQIEHNYFDACLYDMEAAGFIETASGFASLEFIQVLKVISDNIQQPSLRLKAKDLSSLILNRINDIESLINIMQSQHKQLPDNQAKIEEFLNRWHFTSTQNKQLSSLAIQWQNIKKSPLDPQSYNEFKQSKQVIAAIKAQLAAVAQDKLLNR